MFHFSLPISSSFTWIVALRSLIYRFRAFVRWVLFLKFSKGLFVADDPEVLLLCPCYTWRISSIKRSFFASSASIFDSWVQSFMLSSTILLFILFKLRASSYKACWDDGTHFILSYVFGSSSVVHGWKFNTSLDPYTSLVIDGMTFATSWSLRAQWFADLSTRGYHLTVYGWLLSQVYSCRIVVVRNPSVRVGTSTVDCTWDWNHPSFELGTELDSLHSVLQSFGLAETRQNEYLELELKQWASPHL